jgi:hemolysin III
MPEENTEMNGEDRQSASMNTQGVISSPKAKPLLRGWFHAVAAVGAIAVTATLVWLSRDDIPRLLSMLVFGLSMIALYTVSAIYHIGTWSDTPLRVLRSLDHSNISLLIAGTYTPLCFNVLSGTFRTALLIAVWVLAAGGVALSVSIGLPGVTWQVPRVLSTSLYIAMGWISILAMPAFLNALSWQVVALLLFGGALYTIGAIIYARKRPNPFPTVLGFHEIFHLFVIAGSIVFIVVIWVWVLPYPKINRRSLNQYEPPSKLPRLRQRSE